MLNLEDPVVGGVRRAGHRAGGAVPERPPVAGRAGRRGRLDRRRRRSSGCRWPAAASPRRARAAGSCRWTSWASPGRHNVSNALAAIAVGLLFGVAPDAIRRAAAAFTGVEHRLQSVGLVDGVRFVNDSQGTQPDAVIAALRAFPAPVVLIAGGRDKGVDLGGAGPGRRPETASAAVLIGESGPTLEGLFREAGLARTARAATLDEAVAMADGLARECAGRLVPRAPSRRCSSARPPPRSTCSRTTRPAAARSSPPSRGSRPARAPPPRRPA